MKNIEMKHDKPTHYEEYKKRINDLQQQSLRSKCEGSGFLNQSALNDFEEFLWIAKPKKRACLFLMGENDLRKGIRVFFAWKANVHFTIEFYGDQKVNTEVTYHQYEGLKPPVRDENIPWQDMLEYFRRFNRVFGGYV